MTSPAERKAALLSIQEIRSDPLSRSSANGVADTSQLSDKDDNITNHNAIHMEVDLKQEIHVIIQSSRLLSKNLKIKIYKIVILPVVLHK